MNERQLQWLGGGGDQQSLRDEFQPQGSLGGFLPSMALPWGLCWLQSSGRPPAMPPQVGFRLNTALGNKKQILLTVGLEKGWRGLAVGHIQTPFSSWLHRLIGHSFLTPQSIHLTSLRPLATCTVRTGPLEQLGTPLGLS